VTEIVPTSGVKVGNSGSAEPTDPAIRTTHKCHRIVECEVLPARKREEKPCQLGAVHTWHKV